MAKLLHQTDVTSQSNLLEEPNVTEEVARNGIPTAGIEVVAIECSRDVMPLNDTQTPDEKLLHLGQPGQGLTHPQPSHEKASFGSSQLLITLTNAPMNIYTEEGR
jgi:hypothetical protein